VPSDLLAIGVFASRCRLSVKALRHYDELGLLRPEHVDPASGYRYYGRQQAPIAIAIALLRSLEVPLPTIRDLLDGEDPTAVCAVLERERERRAREISRAESALRSIERLMRAGTIFPYEVELRDEPGFTALCVEGTTAAELHISFGKELVGELLARLARLGRRQIGPVVCVMPPAPPDMITLQMCTAIAEPLPSEHVLAVPPALVAATRHVGPYEEIGLAEHTVRAFAEDSGCTRDGDIREVYRNDPEKVAPDALETDVLLPVTRRTGRTPGTAAARR
jgi:DNA-binding transcriptional MerR regulator